MAAFPCRAGPRNASSARTKLGLHEAPGRPGEQLKLPGADRVTAQPPRALDSIRGSAPYCPASRNHAACNSFNFSGKAVARSFDSE